MSAPRDGDPVAAQTDLLRLPTPPPDFEPDDYAPSGDYFVPSTQEREGNGRVSVWDEALTSAEQARRLRGSARAIVLRGGCASVLEAAEAEGKAVQVVYEPLEPPLSDEPGAEGHAGIAGLLRPPGGNRIEYRALREAIAEAFELA